MKAREILERNIDMIYKYDGRKYRKFKIITIDEAKKHAFYLCVDDLEKYGNINVKESLLDEEFYSTKEAALSAYQKEVEEADKEAAEYFKNSRSKNE